jgi:dTDP-4-amino-4,6-dideoxygalactose transaminase
MTQADYPVASKYANEILSLPMYPELKTEQVKYVCNQLKKSINP